MEYLKDGYDALANAAYHNQEVFIVGVALTLMLAISILLRKGRRQWKKMIRKGKQTLRGKIMTKEEREAYNKKIQGDAIFEALDDLVYQGKQTQHDIKKTLRRLANVLSMPDFIPVKNLDMTSLTSEEFELIQGILRSKAELQKLLFAKKKVSIPGPKPGEVDNVTVFMKRARQLAEQGRKEATQKVQFGGNLRKAAAIV